MFLYVICVYNQGFILFFIATNLAVGYKVILQLLTFQKPSIAVANISKVHLLLNSYQNRQVIGLSILWAVGLGGVKDLSVGLKGIVSSINKQLLIFYIIYLITLFNNIFGIKEL